MTKQMPQQVGTGRKPDYKPASLRWPYMTALGVYICLVVVALEYANHNGFPVATQHRDIPHDSSSGPFLSVPLVHAREAPTHESLVSATSTGYLSSSTENTASTPPQTVSTNLTEGVRFANRIGYLDLNRLLSDNSTQGNRTHARRDMDPSRFATLGERLRGVYPFQVGWWGGSWTITVSYLAYYGPAISNPQQDIMNGDFKRFPIPSNQSGFAVLPGSLNCSIICEGSALVFVNQPCWEMWNRMAREEAGLDAKHVVASEIEMGEQKCQATHADTATATGIRNPIPATTTWVDRRTTPATAGTQVNSIHDANTQRNSDNENKITLSDQQGRPTATKTPMRTTPAYYSSPSPQPLDDYPGPDQDHYSGPDQDGPPLFHPVSPAEYFFGSFPALLTIPIAVAAQMANADLMALLPFHALTRPGGASVSDSLCLSSGWRISFIQLLVHGEPLFLLSDVLAISSIFVVALSSETIGTKLYGNCTLNDFTGCRIGIALFRTPSRVLEALLILMVITLMAMALLLRHWLSGVSGPPHLARVASMVRGWELFRNIPCPHDDRGYIGEAEIREYLSRWRFFLRTSSNVHGALSARIEAEVVKTDVAKKRPRRGCASSSRFGKRRVKETFIHMTFSMLLCGFLSLILYYLATRLDTPFERWMDSQSLGVRGMFTGVGAIVSFFWEHHFSHISVLESYRRLARHPQLAKDSILIAPYTTSIAGLPKALRHGQLFTAVVALAAALARVLPALVANIPFDPVQTWVLHRACSWTAVGILSFMISVIFYESVFRKYPHMPVDPYILVGSIYYVCDSDMSEFSEMEFSKQRKREHVRANEGEKYVFRRMNGLSGMKKVGVERVTSVEA